MYTNGIIVLGCNWNWINDRKALTFYSFQRCHFFKQFGLFSPLTTSYIFMHVSIFSQLFQKDHHTQLPAPYFWLHFLWKLSVRIPHEMLVWASVATILSPHSDKLNRLLLVHWRAGKIPRRLEPRHLYLLDKSFFLFGALSTCVKKKHWDFSTKWNNTNSMKTWLTITVIHNSNTCEIKSLKKIQAWTGFNLISGLNFTAA